MNTLINTSNEWTGFILRMTAAIIMLPHGLQKMFGMFGGSGLKPTLAYFTETMRLPWFIAWLVIFIEVVAPLGLMIGVVSRLWAFLLILIMLGAISTTNAKHGLFMNWYGTQSGEGFEYHLLFIGICTAIVYCGSGRMSIDQILIR